MTALSEYQRLECPGLWRAAPDAQMREVVVSFGDATLMIADSRSMRALAHWSLPAVLRLNPGEMPALYGPGDADTETLELDDGTMIGAIDKVHTIIAARRPHPGRLRLSLLGGGLVAVLGLGMIWMPDAIYRHTAAVVPIGKRQEIGRAVLGDIQRLAGAPCSTPLGEEALAALNTRLGRSDTASIVILREGAAKSLHLPGQIVLLNRSVVEDYETPEVAAGYILAESQRATAYDPLEALLRDVGLGPTFRLLTTGELPDMAAQGYAERLLAAPPVPVADADLLLRFAAVGVASEPYARALDITGESVRGLIEGDPAHTSPSAAVLADDQWISLQGICLN